MAKIVIKDNINIEGSIDGAFDTLKGRLKEEVPTDINGLTYHKAINKIIDDLFAKTQISRSNPARFGFEEDTDPD